MKKVWKKDDLSSPHVLAHKVILYKFNPHTKDRAGLVFTLTYDHVKDADEAERYIKKVIEIAELSDYYNVFTGQEVIYTMCDKEYIKDLLEEFVL